MAQLEDDQVSPLNAEQLREFMETILAVSDSSVCILSVAPGASYRLVYVSPSFEQHTGYQAAEILGSEFQQLVRSSHDQEEIDQLFKCFACGEPCEASIRIITRKGRRYWTRLKAIPVRNGQGNLTHYVVSLRDITSMVDAEEAIQKHKERVSHFEQLAIKDPLTGLYNRRFLEEQLARFWAVHQRLNAKLGLAFVDIDAFKKFNDRYGHVRGDQVLQAVAGVLGQHFKRDSDVVARYGGEEFVIVCSLVSDLPPFEHQLERAQRAIEELHIEHADAYSGCHLTISIGVAYAVPAMGTSTDQLLHAADQAMYRAKAEGGNRLVAQTI